MTQGTAEKYFTPERISIDLTFKVKDQKYEKVLSEGTKSVISFMDEVLKQVGLEKEEMKTRSFKVVEKMKSIKKKEKNQYGQYDFEQVFDCFEFTQSANIKFDYDLSKMTKFIALIAKLKTPPIYALTFEVKNYDEYKNTVLAEAFHMAETKATAIATAARFKTVKCIKTNFVPFEEKVTSASILRSNEMMMFCQEDTVSVADNIEKTFTPEDIHISETLYCLFKAE